LNRAFQAGEAMRRAAAIERSVAVEVERSVGEQLAGASMPPRRKKGNN